jgi:hypothetical protein
VYDELDLPWTALRIKRTAQRLFSQRCQVGIAAEYRRIYSGSGGYTGQSEPGCGGLRSRSGGADEKDVDEVVSYTADAVESIVAEGDKAMAKFNRRAKAYKTRNVRIYEELFVVRRCHR